MKKQTLHTSIAALMAVFTTLMMSTRAMAHPGHDHIANESMLMHVLFYGSVALSIAAVAWAAYLILKKQDIK